MDGHCPYITKDWPATAGGGTSNCCKPLPCADHPWPVLNAQWTERADRLDREMGACTVRDAAHGKTTPTCCWTHHFAAVSIMFLYYDYRRAAGLPDTDKPTLSRKCSCPLTLLLRSGCKCGGK